MATLPLTPPHHTSLDDSDRAFLRSLPRTVTQDNNRRGSSNELAVLRRIRKLQIAGLLTGKPEQRCAGEAIVLALALTDKGRAAIGRPAPAIDAS